MLRERVVCRRCRGLASAALRVLRPTAAWLTRVIRLQRLLGPWGSPALHTNTAVNNHQRQTSLPSAVAVLTAPALGASGSDQQIGWLRRATALCRRRVQPKSNRQFAPAAHGAGHPQHASETLRGSCRRLQPSCGGCPSQPSAGHALVGLLTSEHSGRPGLLVIAQGELSLT